MNFLPPLHKLSSAHSVLKPSSVIKKSLVGSAVLLLLAVTPIIMQALHYSGSDSVVWWLSYFRNAYYINTGIVLILFLFVYTSVNSAYTAGVSVFTGCMLFSIIDSQKMHVLNQPLLPGDLLFIRQGLEIARLYAVHAVASMLLLGLLIAILFLFRKHVEHFALRPAVRLLLLALLGTGTTAAVRNYHPLIRTINHHNSLVNEYWNQLSNYRKNGLLYSFIMNLESLHISRPEGYTKDHLESVLSAWLPDTSTSVTTHSQYPDVIVYLSESFWDITTISPVPLPCDPIAHFRALSKTSPSIKLLSPVFGGNTCNAEFEVLTGMSHGFFPTGVMAYNQLIQHPIPSMIQVFRENGYQTTAIHTFKRWFWNRANVYRQLGFDTFISQETMSDPEVKGMYISDRELARQIITQASLSSKPDLVFALSMQNHGPYETRRYDTLDCAVATGLSEKADIEFNMYLQGLIDADRSLAMITHYIDTAAQPTMVLFFGDHLPGFTHVYKETGTTARIFRDTTWAHTTSALCYANYPLQATTDSLISMVYLSLFITKQAGVEVPPYYQYLANVQKESPLFREPSGQHNTPLQMSSISAAATLRETCRLCIYDALFGKQYADHFHHIRPCRAGIIFTNNTFDVKQ